MRGPRLVLIAWAIVLISQTYPAVRDWQNSVTLWARAVTVSPLKPRPWVNYGAALASYGDLADAHTAWTVARQKADLPWVPIWDRHAAITLTEQNLAAISR